ncbi:MAG: zinc-ribbon domain-containing protein [Candidatus Heimdallarchaeaceae archaeon]
MSYMFCQFCGARNTSNNRFCENCGQSLVETTTPQPRPQPQPAPVRQRGYQPYQQQPSQQGRSITGSYDAVPGQQYPYQPTKPKGVPNWVKVLIVLFFFGLPVLFVIIFFSMFWMI